MLIGPGAVDRQKNDGKKVLLTVHPRTGELRWTGNSDGLKVIPTQVTLDEPPDFSLFGAVFYIHHILRSLHNNFLGNPRSCPTFTCKH